MRNVIIRNDLERVLEEAWKAASGVPGFLLEPEARFLGTVAASLEDNGAIVEIGSFKGKSTVMLAKVCQAYGLGPVSAIDPHNFNSIELQHHRVSEEASTYGDFLANLRDADVTDLVQPFRAYSRDVAAGWKEPIRFLWIDGDHTYKGTKEDFDAFSPHLVSGGIVAFHDALHEFSGPIRVFVEDILRSDQFGPAGFVGSIAWSQFRPADGSSFRNERASLERVAEPLIHFLEDEKKLRGIRKLRFKLRRARIPRSHITPNNWAALINR